MILSLEILLLLCGLSVSIFWLLPEEPYWCRDAFLVAVSLLVLFSLSPLILPWLAAYVAAIAGLLQLAKRGLRVGFIKAASWLLFLPIALVEFLPRGALPRLAGWDQVSAASQINQFALLGLSYCAIRSFLAVREALARRDFRLMPALTALVFFGTYVAGPIAGSNYYVAEARAKQLSLYDAAVALSRIGWGAGLFLVVKPLIANPDLIKSLGWAESSHTAALAWLSMYRSFLTLYVDFYGYCEIAIGVGLLFGIRVPENFRAPLISRSMQEFWQRWHLTLGAFVGTYLFKPLVRSWGRTALAIFISFALIGLWHQFTWTYLIWGMGHGAGLALNMILNKRYGDRELTPVQRTALGSIGWAMTMTWVSLLSAIANSPSLPDAGKLAGALVGF
jgi:D-alanyl-lipoteichoic acid acyltransferase DltB (MBOAT superfamily)